jgi:hypothetical protein
MRAARGLGDPTEACSYEVERLLNLRSRDALANKTQEEMLSMMSSSLISQQGTAPFSPEGRLKAGKAEMHKLLEGL